MKVVSDFHLLSELHTAVIAAIRSIGRINVTDVIAKDLIVLVSGLRVSVLIDYWPRKTIQEDLLTIIANAKSLDPRFSSLKVAKLCENNFLVVHVKNLHQRLSKSISMKLCDYLFVDCTSDLSTPFVMPHEIAASKLLPEFIKILKNVETTFDYEPTETALTEKMLEIGGDDISISMPTLAGWMLEYPVVYFVSNCDTGNCLANLSLNLFHLNVDSSQAGAQCWAASADKGKRNFDSQRFQVFSFSVPASCKVAADKIIHEHLNRICARSATWAKEESGTEELHNIWQLNFEVETRNLPVVAL